MTSSPPPVVLIHGFASSFDHGWGRQGWPELLADEGRTVVGVEMLGHGASERPHDPAAYDDIEGHALAQFPDGVVDAVGFSAGAMTLLRIVLNHPERFRRFVLMGIGDGVFDSGDPSEVISALEAPDGPPVEDILGVSFRRLADAENNDRQALIAFLQRVGKVIDPERVAELEKPALVVIGDRDPAYPSTKLHEQLKGSEMLVIHGLDHFSTPADYRAIDAALRFLAG